MSLFVVVLLLVVAGVLGIAVRVAVEVVVKERHRRRLRVAQLATERRLQHLTYQAMQAMLNEARHQP